VFFSSAGLILNKHYCQNELKNVALFSKASSCHGPTTKKVCPHHQQKDKEDNNCCNDNWEFIKTEQNQEFQPLTQLFIPLPLAPPVVQFTPLQIGEISKGFDSFIDFKPPIVCSEYLPKLQTFLC
jgi:hypothetical protein